MSILEKIGSVFRACGSLIKKALDNPIARFLASAVIGIPCAIAAAAVTVPTIVILRIGTASTGKLLKFVGGERVKTFNAFLVGATSSLQKGTASFFKNFCFYAHLKALSAYKDYSKKFSAAFGSSRTEEDDEHASVITAAYSEGSSQSGDSQTISSQNEYHEEQFSEEENQKFDLWTKQQEAISDYQNYIASVSGLTAHELEASHAEQLEEAEKQREAIAKWRETQGLSPTKFPFPVGVISHSPSGAMVR